MLDTPPYIACINLAGRRAVVVGDGPIADEKVAGLTAAGARVDAMDANDYEARVLEGAYLVIVATDDLTVARRIFEDAEARSMLVNVADVPELCNFILPAIARRGPLAVAISTSGASPALAKRMKREAGEMFGDAYALLAVILDDLRPWAKQSLPDYAARRDFFEGIVNGDPDPIELLQQGREEEVRAAIAVAQHTGT